MSMLRSLDSAVSGLRNHQVRMDIIGNNIANVNTIGFKTGRVTFEESLTQLLKGSTRPPGDGGGTNPIQIGQGMSIGSIDTLFSQGNLESTGQVTDLAIEGDSFFAVSNGQGTFYTRNGAFQLDAKGNVVLPTNGFVLQGKIADSDGNFPSGSVVQNISIPLNEQSPARATTEINFGKNLDSDSQALGTIHNSQAFLESAAGTDLLTGLKNENGESLNIKAGDILTFNGNSLGVPISPPGIFIVTVTSTINDLTDAPVDPSTGSQGIETWIQANMSAGAIVDIQADGSILFDPLGGPDIESFQLTSDNPLSTGFITNAFAVPTTISTLGTNPTGSTVQLNAPAEAGAFLVNLKDSEGNALGLENGDEISIQGQIGGKAAVPGVPIVYDDNTIPGNGTTLQNIMDKVKEVFRLAQTDGTFANNPTVSMNLAGSDDNIPDGSLVVRGLAGDAFSLDNISIRASNDNQSNPSPTNLNGNFNFDLTQESRDPKVFDTSITIFDQSGDNHIITTSFVPTQTPGEWQWKIEMAGDEVPLGGRSGTLIFDQDGTVSSFSFDDNATQFSFDPNNGSDIVEVQLNVGGPGDFRGLTQFRAPTSASIVAQDGFTTGSLREISVNEAGMISGIFTNGVNKPLAQVMLVDFINPGGLLKVSDSVYSISNNSGDPVFITPGGGSTSKIKPGALEISNVEMALQFTEMITTQRGYQANARGITVSDSMLEELVNLKR